MTVLYTFAAGIVATRTHDHLRDAAWPAPMLVVYAVALLAGLLWPIVVLAWVVEMARQ